MMQKILSRREKMLAAGTAGVVVFVVIFNFLIAPALDRSELLDKEIGLARIKLARYNRLLAQKEQLQSKYGTLLGQAESMEPAGPDASVNVLADLENMAKNANIRIIEVRPQAGSAKETLIDLRTEGSMENYIRFLYDVENSLSLLTIHKFQLNARPDTQLLEGVFSISQLSLQD